HVLDLRCDEALDGFREAEKAPRRFGLVGGDRRLELDNERAVVGVLVLELVQRRVELVRAFAKLAEEIDLLLRVMQRFGERLDVMEHGAEQRKRWRHPVL